MTFIDFLNEFIAELMDRHDEELIKLNSLFSI